MPQFQGRKAAITGVGLSALGRRLDREGLSLAVDAASAALHDAGIAIGDIDGLACWPGRVYDLPAASPVGIWDLIDAMGIRPNWYAGGTEGPAQLSSILNAVLAVSSGYARHVLCFRAFTETSPALMKNAPIGVAGGSDYRPDNYLQWLQPFNSLSLANWMALAAQRHAHVFGTTREQLGWIALNARRNAARNPDAVYKAPLTMEDYLASRMISTPLCLYDCDVPIDGAIAIIVSAADAARDRPKPPIYIEAISGALSDRCLWDQRDLTRPAAFDAAARLWSMTDLKPADVDVAQLYDGFSIVTLNWLEALGFCGFGESGAFIDGGERISLNGELPLNTGGGQLSGGRLHGLGHLHEAVIQLRHAGGDRQVPNAPRVAVVANGAGPLASCALLVRDE